MWIIKTVLFLVWPLRSGFQAYLNSAYVKTVPFKSIIFFFSAFLYCNSGALLCYLFHKVIGLLGINQGTDSSCLQNDRPVTQSYKKQSK